jgi:hypothetical protein
MPGTSAYPPASLVADARPDGVFAAEEIDRLGEFFAANGYATIRGLFDQAEL